MSYTESTPLTTADPSKIYYVHDTHRFYSRRRREQLQLRCFTFVVAVAIFTMALIVTVSYSVSHSKDETDTPIPNLTSSNQPAPPSSLSHNLKLSYSSGSYIFGPSNTDFPWWHSSSSSPLSSSPSPSSSSSPSPSSFSSSSNTKIMPNDVGKSALTDAELEEGLQAGQDALQRRIQADTTALASPLPSPSPESRHRYAVSTKSAVGNYALAGVAEIAATRKIEAARLIAGQASAMGAHFDGGWAPSGACKDFLNVNCTVEKYRTYDGTCNRPKEWGSALTPFRRTLPPDYADGIDSPRKSVTGKELPSARKISLNVHKPAPSSNPLFSVMLAVFGQFLDHDITATAISQGVNGSSISCCVPGAGGHPECFPVKVGSGDPVYDVAGRSCMEFVRSAPAAKCKLGPREQLNQVTAFIDGSTIYGPDLQTANDLREFSGGRLKMQVTPDNRTLLPPSRNLNDGCNRDAEKDRGRYCFAAGDARANENLHLTTMHLLWARQHNKLAAEFARLNPSWSDEVIYQESRRLIGAKMQHITYNEFLPIILGEKVVQFYELRPMPEGYRIVTDNPDHPTNDPRIANSFAAAAFRFAHTLLPGLMRMTDAQKGTSSYVELHRMLFNPYSLYTEGGVKRSVQSATGNLIQKTSTHVTSQLTNHLFEDPLGNASIPCGLDLVSLNIQRGRDHGLPGYVKWREYCGLGRVSNFSDLDGHLDPQALQGIETLYDSVEDVDLYTGALAEIPRAGGIVGPTFTCLIADQFVRLQKGDRYWYEIGYQPHSFNPEQLQEIRKFSLARLICDCSDGVTEVQAEVMRAVGPGNPIISCEDIPRTSLESWREESAYRSILQKSSMIDWLSLKKDINDTIQQVVSFIHFTKRSAVDELTSDWLSFKRYVNSSFTDLRNELAKLHPKKVVKTPSLGDSFILRATPQTITYTDWIDLKNDLLKSLNESIANVTIPPIGTQWMEFKQKMKDQFADLKMELSSIKNSWLTSKPASYGYKGKNSGPIDWVSFKDNVIESIDKAIQNISVSMPSADDPAWAKYGEDVKNRFLSIKDKVIGDVSALPTKSKWETESGNKEKLKGESSIGPEDWISYKNEIMQTVNSTVKKIKNGMPPPGDPAWVSYRDEILSDFSVFDEKFSKRNTSTRTSIYDSGRPYLMSSGSSKMFYPASTKSPVADRNLTQLINDWKMFRSKINGSINDIAAGIKSDQSLPIDIAGWITFKNAIINELSNLKFEVADIKSEWIMFNKTGMLNTNRIMVPSLQTGNNKNPSGSDIIIPEADWTEFKNEINNTIMSLLQSMKVTNKTVWTQIGKIIDDSFVDIKNEINSLKDIVSFNKSVPTNWTEFHTKLNKTIKNLVDGLNNKTEMSTIDLMKILLDARDQFVNFDIPANLTSSMPFDYLMSMNKTLSSLFHKFSESRPKLLTLKSIDPSASPFFSDSSSLLSFQSTSMLVILVLTSAAA